MIKKEKRMVTKRQAKIQAKKYLKSIPKYSKKKVIIIHKDIIDKMIDITQDYTY